MKFSELPVGQHFEYEGERYLKSGPLVATHEASGQRRFMPRYGAVTPISAKPETPAPAASPRTVDLGEALAELDAFYARCLDLLTALDNDTGRPAPAEVREQLRQARDESVESLTARASR